MNAISNNYVDNNIGSSVNEIVNMPELSDDERKHMIGVMERAKVIKHILRIILINLK